MKILKHQLMHYDFAATEIDKAAKILEGVNLAKLNLPHTERIHKLIIEARVLRHEMFALAHAAFLRERGLK